MTERHVREESRPIRQALSRLAYMWPTAVLVTTVGGYSVGAPPAIIGIAIGALSGLLVFFSVVSSGSVLHILTGRSVVVAFVIIPLISATIAPAILALGGSGWTATIATCVALATLNVVYFLWLDKR